MATYNQIVCKGTSEICTISGRTYTKDVDGFSLCAYYTTASGYTGPIVCSPTQSVAHYTPYGTGTPLSTTIDGVTWYYTNSDGFMSGDLTASGSYTVKLGTGLSPLQACQTLVGLYNDLVSSISASVSPVGSGTVTSSGTYDIIGFYLNGTPFSVTAARNLNYRFTGWYENSVLVSSLNPYNFNVSADRTLTAEFVYDTNTYTVNAETDFEYGSVYVSNKIAYAGDTVTLWARPFPDYNFVKWSDGETANPRTITVSGNTYLIAEYQRVTESNGIYQYRCFIKDQLSLTSLPKAFLRVDSFDVREDLLTKATSSIVVYEMASNVNEGDVLVLYDPKGQTLYNGVITSIEDKTIKCSQMQSFYKGMWVYDTSSQDYLEHEIAVLLQNYASGKLKGSSYTDPLVAARLGGITIDYVGSLTVDLPSSMGNGSTRYETTDMERFIYDLYEKYGIVLEFEINVSGTNYVHIKIPTFTKISVGNNVFAIQNMLPMTEIEETNRLVIYASDNTYRTTYVATKTGISEEPSSTANRFDITNTKIVFSDDPVTDLVASNLPDTMYNHKLEFDLILKNYVYQFEDFNLGGELGVYYYTDYYDSVLTGTRIVKSSNQNITYVHFICGKVRTALTELLNLGKV